MSAVLAAGLVLLGVAALTDLVRPQLRPAPYVLGALASILFVVAGSGALAGAGPALQVGAASGGLNPAILRVDRLSGLFLVISFAVAVPVSFGFVSWAGTGDGRRGRGMGAAYALTLGAVAVVITADNAFGLLFGWEALTVAFYLLVGAGRDRELSVRASLITIALSKSSGAFLLIGLLLLAGQTGSFRLAELGAEGGVARSAAYVLLIAGFGVKVGLVPLQVWMPSGYAAAPGPARALLAGVAVNVGFYGLWRTLDLLGAPPTWVRIAVLLLGGVTAVLGIAHAAVQTDLARIVAYSSVENAGLIVVGFGIALVGAGVGEDRIVAVGLLAATLQVITHAVAKSLLFSATSGIEAAYGSTDLERLRGVARRVPWSGTGFAIGSLTLAGLPLTAGFVSEWFLLEALLQQFRIADLAVRLALVFAGAMVALTVGFAGVTFIRLVGLIVLGPSDPAAAPGPEVGAAARVGTVALSLACLGIAALAPLETRAIAAGLDPVVARSVTAGALKSPWVLQPVFADFSILSPSWLWVAMPVLLVLTVLVTRGLSGSRFTAIRRVPVWRSATGGVQGAGSYTPFGYANPTRTVLTNVLMTRSEVRELTGREPGSAQAVATARGPQLGYSTDVVELVEVFVWRPLLRPLRALVTAAKRLQSGRLDAYLAYMLIALVAILTVATALA